MPQNWQKLQSDLQAFIITNRGVRLVNAHSFNLKTSKPMNNQTQAKLKAALVTGYILLTACLGIAYFGRFIFALITN